LKKYLSLTLFITITAVISSCTRSYYAPGLYHNDVQFMIKPHSKDSVKTRVYASGVYLAQNGAGSQGGSQSGLLNIYRSHTLPHFNLSYGALGYTGVYSRTKTEDNGTISPLVNKSFYGYGLNGSGSFYLSTRKTDFRIIGIDLTYSHESGSFLAFRKAQVGQPNVSSAAQDGMFSYGIFTEVIIKPGANTNFGFKLFVNQTPGNITRDLNRVDEDLHVHTESSAMLGLTSFIGYKHFNFHTTMASGTTVGDISGAVQFGLAYKF
jgi:hypothetical protein